MVYTNFPSGVTSLGVPVIGSGQLPITSGNYWFVSSVIGSAGNPGNEADLPFATLMGAVNAAASGDVIVLLPNHAETIVAAAGVLVATAGLTVVGMGEGASRPSFTFSTSTAATFRITGASFQMSNVVGICGIDQIVSPFVVAAADCTLGLPGAPVDWHDGSSAIEALRAVLTTAAAARLNINMNYFGFTAGSHGVNAIRLVGVATANININYYGVLTTAVVEFVTTACTNIQVYGYMYVSGVTDFSRSVVDTITGSTWFASFYDGAFGGPVIGGSGAALASANAATVLTNMNVPTANSTANALERDVVGNKTDASVYVPGTTKSIEAYVKGHADLQERVVFKAAAVLANGTVIFTVAGGPIKIEALALVNVVGGDSTAATVQFSVTPTSGSAQTISGASASTANAAAGASVTLAGTALATAALYNASGPNLIANPGTIFCPAGTITMVIGSGPTVTGTWAAYMRYKPLAVGITVS